MELTRKMINGSLTTSLSSLDPRRGWKYEVFVLLRQHPHPRFISSTLTFESLQDVQTPVNCRRDAEIKLMIDDRKTSGAALRKEVR